MKRRQPLRARVELARTTPLERGTRPLRSSGPTKARRRDTGPTKAVRDLVKERADYRCEMCRHSGMDVHHRRPRALGGSSDPATNLPSNLVLLCRECHSWVESHREVAEMHGWLVRQGVDPTGVVLWLRDHRVLLTDDGLYLYLPTSQEAS